MKNIKRIFALAIVALMMVPACAFAADVDSPTAFPDGQWTLIPDQTTKVYNEKKANVTVVGYYGDEYVGKTTVQTDSADVGTYELTPSDLKYNGKACDKSFNFTITKAEQEWLCSPQTKKFKYSKVKKKAQSYTIKVVENKSGGDVTFSSSSSKLKVGKTTGKVTVKKGTKKGTYKVTIKCAATKNYKAGKTKTFYVKAVK